MDEKKVIRKSVFAKRAACPMEEIESMSQKICENLCSLKEWKEAQYIYAYADYNKEVITRYMIEAAWAQDKRVAVPKVDGKDMIFYELTDFDQLAPGYYDIPEPASGEIVHWDEALMIMPGVAFDGKKHRVGYGGGFYDRFLEKHTKHPTAAVAFEFQMVEEAPYEALDIQPQILVTEKRIYR